MSFFRRRRRVTTIHCKSTNWNANQWTRVVEQLQGAGWVAHEEFPVFAAGRVLQGEATKVVVEYFKPCIGTVQIANAYITQRICCDHLLAQPRRLKSGQIRCYCLLRGPEGSI